MGRILYVSRGYCTHDRRFLERLAKTRHEMWFLPCDGTAIQRQLAPPGSLVHWLPALSESAPAPGTPAWHGAAKRFRHVVGDLSPDLIHAGPIPTGGFFAAASGFHPFLLMSWGSDVLAFPDEGPDELWITKFALQRADMMIADCEAGRQRIAVLGGLASNQIVCLPWGVDLKTFRPKASTLNLRQRLGWAACKLIISARSLEQVHNPLVFLAAMKKVMMQREDVRVLMLGAGSLKHEVESFIRKNGLARRFHLAGHVPEETLPDFLAEADLYVSATSCDGSSISLLQAMACGLPVAVADSAGNKEWVTHGENGWLHAATDAEALSQSVLAAFENDAGRQLAAERNVHIANSRADWDKNFAQVLDAYDELLAHKGDKEVGTNAQLQNR
jgi:L-malate glycosyltransferase